MWARRSSAAGRIRHRRPLPDGHEQGGEAQGEQPRVEQSQCKVVGVVAGAPPPLDEFRHDRFECPEQGQHQRDEGGFIEV